jgi:predicted patatin/cPLA2 family phospholipase
MPPHPKTAVILIGGGMRSAHGGGFLHAMGTYLGIRRPDIIIGSSGNAGNALYYATQQQQQYDYLERIWKDLLSGRDFISYLRFYKILNIDYLVDDVLKRLAPMDVPALERSPIDYFVPVTEVHSGITRYVGKEDRTDMFEVVRASCAVPFFYGKKVPLPWGTFIDGEIGPTTLDHVTKAMQLGARNILVVSNMTPRTRAGDLTTHVYAQLVSKGLADAIRHDLSGVAGCVSAQGARIVCIEPDIPISNLAHSPQKLAETFDSGVHDALALEDELRTLFI